MSTTRSRTKRTDGSGGYWYVASEGRWRARFTDTSGRRRNLSAPTEEAIVRKLESERTKLVQGALGLAPGQTPTVEVWLQEWLSSKADLSPKSRERHDTDIRLYIVPNVGHIRLDKLSPLQIEHLYGRLATEPSQRRPSGLSASSIRRVHAVLAAALADAHRLGVLATPIMHRVRAPRASEKRIEVLSVSEVEDLLEASAKIGLQCRVRWAIAAKWGLRQGEVLGLRWSDINLATGRIEIQRQVQRQQSAGLVIKAPKANSYRHLVIDGDTLADLNTLFGQSHGRSIGTTRNVDRYIFPNARGGAMDPMNDQHQFKRLLADAGMRSVGVHTLRHTALTRMIEQGVPLAVVKEIAGHADIRTTMRYLHLADSRAKSDAAQLVQQVYGNATPDAPLPEVTPSARRIAG